MKQSRLIQAFALVGALCVPMAYAQPQQPQQQQEQTQKNAGNGSQSPGVAEPIQPIAPKSGASEHTMPVPAGRAVLPPYETLTEATTRQEPDTHTLSGGETFGLGSLSGFQRLFDPAVFFSESGDTGIVAGHTDTVTAFGGSLGLVQEWGHYRLAVAYRGAKTIYHPDSFYDQEYHDLNFSQTLFAGRWTLRIRDDLTYSPQATFGGLDIGGPGFYEFNPLLTSIEPSLSSSDTILTGRARRLDNTALGEIDYALSRRTTLTFTGSYALLHFLDSGYIDSRDINGRIGYDYALDPRDTISVLYGFNRFSFSGAPSKFYDQMAQIAFGRKITGRLAFQVAAGPQLIHYNNSAASGGNQLSWSVSSGITYAMRRSSYSLSYSHGISGGSGVFLGAYTDTVTASVGRRFTRFWSGNVNGGYARNNNLTSGSGITTGQFNDWFGGVNLGRQLGRHMQINMSYALQKQYGSGVICQVASCGFTRLRQMFGVTIEWHPLATGLYE